MEECVVAMACFPRLPLIVARIVDLNRNRLSGRIPVAVVTWRFLSYFLSQSNQLSGLIPDVLESWQEVHWVSISFNRLTGLSEVSDEMHFLGTQCLQGGF